MGEVGYFLANGGASLFLEYQVDLYRGSGMVDGLLAMLGALVLGDHFLAWRGVGLAYLLGISVLGDGLLRRAGDDRAAGLFLALLASAPFVLRDGVVAMVGSHSSTIFWALLSVELATRRTLAPARAAFFSGALLGFAVWYTRTAVVFVPLVGWLAVVRPGGSRTQQTGWFIGGLAVFPVLCVAQALAVLSSSRAEAGFGFPRLLGEIVWTIKQSAISDAGLLRKLPDVVGMSFADRLFALPRGLAWLSGWQGVSEAAGYLWSAALAIGVPLAATMAYRRPRGGGLLLGLAVAPVFPIGAYLFSSLRVEESLFFAGIQWAPAPTEVRYISGGLVLLLLPLALVLSTAWDRRQALGAGLAGVLVGSGLLMQLAHPRSEDGPALGEIRAFRGGAIYGLTAEMALTAAGSMADGYARASHLRIAGFKSREVGVAVDAGGGAIDAPTWVRGADRRVFFEGVGRRLGDLMTEGLSLPAAVDVVREGPGDAEESLWRGLGESPMGRGALVQRSNGCAEVPELCWTVAAASLGETKPFEAPTGGQLVEGTSGAGATPPHDEWLFGLGFAYGEVHPFPAEGREFPAGWSAKERESFVRGWRAGGRFRFR